MLNFGLNFLIRFRFSLFCLQKKVFHISMKSKEGFANASQIFLRLQYHESTSGYRRGFANASQLKG